MSWRVAKSLEVLLHQLNSRFPSRDKSSDGAIGDAAHASRSSDHNPWVRLREQGIVTARDFTNDPAHGLVSDRLAEILRERRDLRIKYVISNRRIYSGTNQKNPAWVWRPYAGKNPHTHHVHVSVKEDPIFFDDERLWELDNFKPTTEQMKAPFPTPKPVLRLGSEGLVVTQLQELLSIYVDGRFGIETLQAVKAFQLKNSLTPDGIVGKYTWEALTALKGEVDK